MILSQSSICCLSYVQNARSLFPKLVFRNMVTPKVWILVTALASVSLSVILSAIQIAKVCPRYSYLHFVQIQVNLMDIWCIQGFPSLFQPNLSNKHLNKQRFRRENAYCIILLLFYFVDYFPFLIVFNKHAFCYFRHQISPFSRNPDVSQSS